MRPLLNPAVSRVASTALRVNATSSLAYRASVSAAGRGVRLRPLCAKSGQRKTSSSECNARCTLTLDMPSFSAARPICCFSMKASRISSFRRVSSGLSMCLSKRCADSALSLLNPSLSIYIFHFNTIRISLRYLIADF